MSNKKTIIRIGILAGVILVSACGFGFLYSSGHDREQDADTLWSKDWKDSYCDMYERSYTDDGILYYQNYLRFCDNKTGEDNLICVDQDCSHLTDSKSDCSAYITEAALGGIAVRGDHIMYVADPDTDSGKCALYYADLEGKNRTKIADLTHMDKIFDVIYHQNIVYISYMDEAIGEQKKGYGIYKYDLEERDGKVLFEDHGNGFAADGMALGKDTLYFSYVVLDAGADEILTHRNDEEYEESVRCQRILGIDIASDQTTAELEGYGNGCVLSYRNGCLFYTKDQDLYVYHEDQKMSEKINEKEDLVAVSGGYEGAALFLNYDEKTDELIYMQYQTETGEWTELGRGTFYPEYVCDDYIYGMTEDKELCWISTKDLIKAGTTETHIYQSSWQEG